LLALALGSGFAALDTGALAQPLPPDARVRGEAGDADITPPGPARSVAAAHLAGPAIPAERFRLPVPDFIERVYGSLLGFSITMEPAVRAMGGTVELRLFEPVERTRLHRLAGQLLAAHGVRVASEGRLLLFRAAAPGSVGQAPVMTSAGTLGGVGADARVAVHVPLEVVSLAKVTGWVQEEFASRGVAVEEDESGNALLLSGPAGLVAEALRFTRALDHPMLRGQESEFVPLEFADPQEVARDLERILESEGIAARRMPVPSAVVVLPLETWRALLVFAPDRPMLEHARDWIAGIERERRSGSDFGVYSYSLSHAGVERVVEALTALQPATPRASAARTPPAGNEGDEREATAEGDGGSPPRRSPEAPGTLAADRNRNAVVFRGSGREWLRLVPVIRQLDTRVPAVVVDVLVAELALGDRYASGVEWLMEQSFDDHELQFGTLDGLALGKGGFDLELSDAGETRALVNLFYGSDRIAIRSKPRLTVNSGHSARIDVGDEIPLLSSFSRSTADSDAPVVNNVEYRRTGLELEIRPVVLGSDAIEIEVIQSLSRARPTSSSDIGSPTILNRSLETTVNLRDGGSVLLGGLVASREGGEERGVPAVTRLPGIGRLFDARAASADRTELLILIVPRLLRSPGEAAALVEIEHGAPIRFR
jgi:general secretion pathway protein D